MTTTAPVPTVPLAWVKFTPAQYRKAIAAIQGGHVHPDGDDYLVRSSDGTAAYVVSAHRQTCTCPAGQLGRTCYHLAAALAMTEGAAR